MREARGTIATVVAAIVVVLTLPWWLQADTASKHWETPLPVLTLGVIAGLAYALLSVGLVLVYRSNGILNFAHGQIGAFAAAVFGIGVIRWNLPYWFALPLALVLGGTIGATAEIAVVRRLRSAPRVMSVVATLGVGQVLVFAATALNSEAQRGSLYPQPPFLPEFDLGALKVTRSYSAMLILAPMVVALLVGFFRRSSYGLAMRSAASNPEAARMAGISASRMSALAWVIAGALSALTAILTQPTLGFVSPTSFGPSLLLIALAGAVVARMQSLPIALAAGIGVGVLQQLLAWNYTDGGLFDVAIFVVILAALLLQRPHGAREDDRDSWSAVAAFAPLSRRASRIWYLRRMGVLVGLAAVVIAVALPLFISNASSTTMTTIFGFAVVGLAVGLVTGTAGQLTLGQFAIASIGAVTSFHVVAHGGAYPLAWFYAGCVGAVTGLIVGLPALRVRGLLLTVTTLAFASVVSKWVLRQSWALGVGVDPGRPSINGYRLDTGRSYYYLGLAILVLACLVLRNVRSGGFGRVLIGLRDNENAARAFTVPVIAIKAQAFMLAGFVAGVGGAMLGHASSRVDAGAFPIGANIDIVVMTVIGGVSLLIGPVIGAAFVIGLPAFVHLDSAGLAVTALGQLVIIMYLPRGLTQLVNPVHAFIVRAALRRESTVDEADDDDGEVAAVVAPIPIARVKRRAALGGLALQADSLVKHYGGVTAVDGVSFTVANGEVVGLIGPNGAGKTTTFEILSGFVRPDGGTVGFGGRDITWMRPEQRGRLGLVRSFQDAALFPTMSVTEAVNLSFERVRPTALWESVVGRRGPERWKNERTRELLSAMGLDGYRDAPIGSLSTGTRRIAELACLVGLEPTVLLLDEPSSGIAQRETEALGATLRDLKERLNLTLVVIEHDIPLIMGLADRIIAMDAGRVIASGTPAEVRADPVVVAAYLGADHRTLERSDSTPTRRSRK